MWIAAVIGAGFLAGVVHVLVGADHLAAVAPLAADGRRRAWRAGFRWGLGHAGGVAIVALAALALRDLLPLEALGHWSERMVGAVLIGIGVWAAFAAISSLRDPDRIGGHVHPPGQDHGHAGGSHGDGHRHLHGERAALAVGLLHGTAGAAHVVGILPALALPSGLAAGSYLAAFGAGTVFSMTAFAALLGVAGVRLDLAGRRAHAGLMGGCAAASIAVGVFWLLA